MAHSSDPRDSQWYVQTPTHALIVTSANVSCKKCLNVSICVLSLVHNMTLVLRASQEKYFFTSQILFLVLIFDNLIGWTLANVGNTTLK